MSRPMLVSIAAISSLAIAPQAFAQNADAEKLFGDGDALMKQGKLAEACDAFEASNRIEARAGTLIRLGECREANRQLASAWSAYKDALVRVKDPKKKEIATKKVADIEPRLSYLTVAVAPDARTDGLAITRNGTALDPALWNRALPVNGGEYTVVARAPGKADWKNTVTVPDEKGKIAVDVPKLQEPGAAGPKPPPTTTTATTAPRPPPVDDDDREQPAPSRWTGKRKIALALGGVAVLNVAIGALLGSAANGRKDDAYKLCPDPQVACNDADTANNLLDEADRFALDANIVFGIAGAAAVAGGVLWVIGKPTADHRVSVAPTRHGVVVMGRF
jgi:hypothetical protein